jgi:hypothetical protein
MKLGFVFTTSDLVWHSAIESCIKEVEIMPLNACGTYHSKKEMLMIINMFRKQFSMTLNDSCVKLYRYVIKIRYEFIQFVKRYWSPRTPEEKSESLTVLKENDVPANSLTNWKDFGKLKESDLRFQQMIEKCDNELSINIMKTKWIDGEIENQTAETLEMMLIEAKQNDSLFPKIVEVVHQWSVKHPYYGEKILKVIQKYALRDSFRYLFDFQKDYLDMLKEETIDECGEKIRSYASDLFEHHMFVPQSPFDFCNYTKLKSDVIRQSDLMLSGEPIAL